MISYSALGACLSAGYGVLFTVVADFRDAYGISDTSIGWIIGIGFLAGFVSQMLIAPIADRGHARAVILIGVLVNAVGLLLMGIGSNLTLIVTGRVVSGLAVGAASPAIRRVVVLADPDNLGQNLGRLMSANVFGFGFGPALSAILVGPFGLAAPFLVIVAASLFMVPLTMGTRVAETEETSARRFATDLLSIRPFAGAVVLGSTVFLMIGAFDALWDVVHSDLGTPSWLANLGITLFSLPLVILGPFGGRLAQKTGPFRLAAAGLVSAAVAMATYGLLPSGGWIFTVAMLHATVDGLTLATSGIAVAMTVPPERQAGAQGVLGAGQALAAGAMATGAGALYGTSGRAAAYGVTAAVMIVMTAFGMALAAPVWTTALRDRPGLPQQP